jgi:hypothetical protein
MIQAFANSCLTAALVVLTQGPPPAGPPQTQPTPTTPPSPAPYTAPLPWRPLPSPVGDDAPEDAVAIHVKRAITVSGEPIDDATILVRGGKIAAIGKLVDVPKGARHLDYSEWTAMPGLVVPLSRAGYVMKAPPQGAATKGRDGIDPRAEIYGIAAKAGITTMAVVPPGTGIVGQASVIRTVGKDLDGMVRRDDAYLFSTFEMSTTAKDQLRQAFDKARETMEQMEKASKEAPAPAPASAPALRRRRPRPGRRPSPPRARRRGRPCPRLSSPTRAPRCSSRSSRKRRPFGRRSAPAGAASAAGAARQRRPRRSSTSTTP